MENRTYSIVPTKLGVGALLKISPGRHILECMTLCNVYSEKCIATNSHLISYNETLCHLFSDTRASEYSFGDIVFAGK